MAKYPKPDPPPPPVTKRPKCPSCHKPLRPYLEVSWKRVDGTNGGFHMEPERRWWTGRYTGYGKFCSLKCCDRFANAAYRGGYRTAEKKHG